MLNRGVVRGLAFLVKVVGLFDVMTGILLFWLGQYFYGAVFIVIGAGALNMQRQERELAEMGDEILIEQARLQYLQEKLDQEDSDQDDD